MQMSATRVRPGLRRVLDALSKLASELEAERKNIAQVDWPASFIEGQKNVIKHYRHVLATQRMSPAEREALLDRIARIEDEIRALQGAQTPPSALMAA